MNRERSFIYIGASILVAVVVLLFLARPQYVAMLQSKKDLDEAKTSEAKKAQELADTQKLVSDYASTPQAKIQDLNAHIPDFTNEADIIAELEAMGKSSRALISSIRFSQGEKAAFGKTIFPLNVTLVATGSYAQLKDLVGSLEQSKRIFNMTSASFSTVSNALTSSINFTAYYSNIDKPVPKSTTPTAIDQ